MYYGDVKSVELASDGTARLFKVEDRKGSYTVTAYPFNCNNRGLRSKSTAAYHADGNVRNTSEIVKEWESAVLDNFGETLYSGMCPAIP